MESVNRKIEERREAKAARRAAIQDEPENLLPQSSISAFCVVLGFLGMLQG